ncbi:MAG TPA: TetR/AcrR family transcriptional regulator [Candidatus Lustribacter sp.]|nr:TetR/AcrR family transcriptional regulator [Candidatus Lustribacter sp.]
MNQSSGSPARSGSQRPVGRPPGASPSGIPDKLIAAAWSALLAGDTPTVAGLCEAVPCTPPSLYHHFGSVHRLILAASEREFALFRERLAASVATAASPEDAIRRRGRAYLDWGLANPGAYRVLFMSRGVPGSQQHGGVAEGGDGLSALVDDVRAAMAAGSLGGGDPMVVALAHWAAVHGLTSLGVCSPDVPRGVLHAALEVLADALSRPAAGSA